MIEYVLKRGIHHMAFAFSPFLQVMLLASLQIPISIFVAHFSYKLIEGSLTGFLRRQFYASRKGGAAAAAVENVR